MTIFANPLRLADSDGDSASLEAFCCSGNSPTIHLIGIGAVGQALLRQLAAAPICVVAASDSSGTIHDRDGLDGTNLADFKQHGGAIVDRTGAQDLPLPLALDLVDADIVIDATATDYDRGEIAAERSLGVLRRGRHILFAAKHALAHDAPRLLHEATRSRIGINAVLGGTGLALLRELGELRSHTHAVTAVGNATTTAIIEAIERGLPRDHAIHLARQRGLLEANPALDLDGIDAAAKLWIVSGALFGQTPPAPGQHIGALNLDEDRIRSRRRRGQTTRLVVRATRDGEFSVSYESVESGSPLAVPSDRVAYCYESTKVRRVHIGLGLGPERTARAVLIDLHALIATGGAA